MNVQQKTEKINVILFDNDRWFDLEQIKEALLLLNVKEGDIFVHSFESNNTKEDIKEFLSNPNGFWICEAELFTGMEADSVVYFLNNYVATNVRVNLMRACSKLNIVYCYLKDNSAYTEFSSAKLDPTFMNGCDEEMKRWAVKCLTCMKNEKKIGDDKEDEDDIVVCKSCFIGCHRGHDIEMKSVEYDLKKESVTCECKTKCLNCTF